MWYWQDEQSFYLVGKFKYKESLRSSGEDLPVNQRANTITLATDNNLEFELLKTVVKS